MLRTFGAVLFVLFFTRTGHTQQKSYPRNYFRHPLDIRMELVANFGEIRTNHWHMGLDIRTQQRENLPVYAAAEGYVSRVSVEPGGFGQAIYINHPNGYTTLYAHLNAFYPALASYVKQQQYDQESWRVNLTLPPGMFPVRKGQFIARSGNTGGSAGPHVHFEIRDTQTENCLNPLLFTFPIPDGVPPFISKLVMYDRNRSSYEQSPQVLSLKRNGSLYTVNPVRVGSNRISFAIGAVDRFTGTPNPNGIYSARILMDGTPVSGFVLDDISYNDTRYMNAQIDYAYQSRGGGAVQHISPLPGARTLPYQIHNEDGFVNLTDTEPHEIEIEVRDAHSNLSRIRFTIQYDPSLQKMYTRPEERLVPNAVNVIERDAFELYTTEYSIYDTVPVTFTADNTGAAGAVSSLFHFVGTSIPVHDLVSVRLRPAETIPDEARDRIIIKNVSGTRTTVTKASWQSGWLGARFRQFGTYQAFIDTVPPTVNAPVANLSKATRIVFTPKDNFNTIKNFRVELNGKWLRFTNDKGRNWIYTFDENFPRGNHELKVIVEDEAGNVLEKVWGVRR